MIRILPRNSNKSNKFKKITFSDDFSYAKHVNSVEHQYMTTKYFFSMVKKFVFILYFLKLYLNIDPSYLNLISDDCFTCYIETNSINILEFLCIIIYNSWNTKFDLSYY